MAQGLSALYITALVVICLAIYYLNSLFALRNTTDLPTNKKYLLVIAHPDDECMFFSPAIIGLLSGGNTITVLCLSSGDADGIGKVREKELRQSGLLLGCGENSTHTIHHDGLQDSMTATWEPKIIAREVALFMKARKETTFDGFITFDEYGVSGHANHISILPGLKQYLSSIPKTQAKPQLWKLLTTSLVRKYSFLFDALPCLALATLRVARAPGRGAKKKENFMVFMSDPFQVWRGQRAMVTGHPSQMRWFRWFWVIIGRYMYFNELRKVLD